MFSMIIFLATKESTFTYVIDQNMIFTLHRQTDRIIY